MKDGHIRSDLLNDKDPRSYAVTQDSNPEEKV